MTKYIGLFIGGPEAGKYRTHDRKWIGVVERLGMTDYAHLGPTEVMAPFLRHFTYRFVAAPGRSTDGYWVDRNQPQTMEYVMSELHDAYWKYNDLCH